MGAGFFVVLAFAGFFFAALTVSILGMVVATLGMGVLPGHASIGAAAPILLTLLRLLQGLAVGGESAIANVFMVEHAPTGRRALSSAIGGAGYGVGIEFASLAALACASTLSPAELQAWGWRIPFWFSLVVGLAGLYIRRALADTLFPMVPPRNLHQAMVTSDQIIIMTNLEWANRFAHVPAVKESVAMIPNGASIMIGGFMAVGTPERAIDEMVRQKKCDLTVIANDTATPQRGIGKLINARLVRKAIVSHIGLNPETQQQMVAGEIEVELVPQGTLIERIRAGGYGLGGVLTQTGIGTPVESGKQQVEVGGKYYLLETPLHADFALVQAFLADYLGNLGYALTARNFNPLIAMAATTVIAAADNIVPIGVIAPDHVGTPAPLVDYLVANG